MINITGRDDDDSMPCCYQMIAVIGDFQKKMRNRWKQFSEGFLWEYRVVFIGFGEGQRRIGLVEILTNGITTSNYPMKKFEKFANYCIR